MGRAERGKVELLEAISGRRATRAFLSKAVDRAALEALFAAAVQAPSARNAQPWRFAVIERRSLLEEISQAAIRRLAADPYWRQHLSFPDPAFDIFYGAPALVVICSQGNGFDPTGECYLAGQNLMLAAHAAGLATCPIGFARETLRAEPMRRTLSLPAGVDPVLPIAVGHPKGEMPPTPRNPPIVCAWLR